MAELSGRRSAPAPFVPRARKPADVPAVPPYAATGAKLGWTTLGFVCAVVLGITLQPFVFAAPRLTMPLLWGGPFDVVANVVLFVPLGFLLALTRAATTPGGAGGARRTLRVALAVGAALSAGIECVQLFEPGRYPSPTDVVTNASGALLGAWLHGRAARRLGADSPLVGRLGLELPVMGLVYVTLPLCTLAALTVGEHGAPAVAGVPVRPIGLLLLGAFGGALLGTVQRRHFGPRRLLDARTTALAAGLWFAIGALPALATARAAFGSGVALATLVAWGIGRGHDEATRPIERRFETEALLRAAPAFVLYLLLLPAGDVPATDAAGFLTKLTILRRVELLTAFTVAGYLLAEGWGRRELRYRFTAWRVLGAAGGALVALALLRAWLARPALAPLATAACALAAGYGGWIYHLQRAHVQALVAARSAGGAAGAPARAGGVDAGSGARSAA